MNRFYSLPLEKNGRVTPLSFRVGRHAISAMFTDVFQNRLVLARMHDTITVGYRGSSTAVRRGCPVKTVLYARNLYAEKFFARCRRLAFGENGYTLRSAPDPHHITLSRISRQTRYSYLHTNILYALAT